MDGCKEFKIDSAYQPSSIESSSCESRCEVKDCKRQGTFVLTKCYHYLCGGCLTLQEKFYIDGDEIKKTAYVCPVCIQRNWHHPGWTSMKSVLSLLTEMSFCMQCKSEEAVCRVNCGHLFCLKCYKGKECHPTCKVTDCFKGISKEERDYLDRSISEVMVWNKIKFPNDQFCDDCSKEAVIVLRQCNHGFCHSCVQKLKNHPDPGRSIVHGKVFRCPSLFCKTTIAAIILDNYLKFLQSKETKIAVTIELSIQNCRECQKNDKDEIKIRNKSCFRSHIFCKNCLYKNRKNAKLTPSKQNQEMESFMICPSQWCETATPLFYLEAIFDNISGKTCTTEIFLRKATLFEKCGKCKHNYACVIRLVCSHGMCIKCVKNEMKVKTAYSICNEGVCQKIIPVMSIIKFLQENFELVTLDELKTDNAGCKFDAIIAEIDSKKLETQQNYTCYEEENKSTLQVESELHLATDSLNGLKTTHDECKSGFAIAEIGSTQSETQQKYTCYEEENKSTLQTESELHLTTTLHVIDSDGGHCEICDDLAVAEIGNCFHKYCLQCISVLLTSSSADEKSIGCVVKDCKTQICQRTLKEFSMSPMVKQKEMLKYFEVKPDKCGIRRCLNQGIIKARNCSHSFCLGCIQTCTPGGRCEVTTCRNLKLPPNHHFEMLITSLLNKADTKMFPFTDNIESKTVNDDWICSCRSKGSLKIVRCGHKMCKDCIRMHELTHDNENLITIARCNDVSCKEFFILPMYGTYVKQNEIKESDPGINQASLSCKRQIESVKQDGCDPKTITTLQQETSLNSPATKKKIKLEKGIEERENTEQTRNLDRRKDSRGRKTESLGLRNVGLSCYRNCILQVLAETPYFIERLERFLDRLKGSSQEEQNTWIRHLRTVLVGIRTKSTEDHIEELHQFHHEFNKSNPEYREYVQEDCLSFLTTLLNGIQEAHQEKRGNSINPAGLFHGKWKDKYKCLNCSMEDFYNESEFFYLPLPYKEKNNGRTTIGSCLLGLFEKEMVDLFTCSKCGNAQMTKEVAIEFFPTILVLQFSKLSEVDESNQDRSLRKKANFVQFWDQFNGLTNKELKKKIGKDTLKPYRLFGVVVHWGSERSGHYISFVKRKDGQNWQRCDDSYVSDASLVSVLDSNAYLLFYERCETQIE